MTHFGWNLTLVGVFRRSSSQKTFRNSSQGSLTKILTKNRFWRKNRLRWIKIFHLSQNVLMQRYLFIKPIRWIFDFRIRVFHRKLSNAIRSRVMTDDNFKKTRWTLWRVKVRFSNEKFLAIMPHSVSSGPFNAFALVLLKHIFEETLGFIVCYVDIITELMKYFVLHNTYLKISRFEQVILKSDFNSSHAKLC